MSGTAAVEWRLLYGRRWTVFVKGFARGDYYEADGDAFRVRFWPRLRVHGGDEQYVLGEVRARQALSELADKALAAEGEG